MKILFAAVMLFPASYYFSYFYGALYTGGDQIPYTGFYLAIADATLQDIPVLQFGYTGSAEPLYGLLAWAGSRLMPKNEWFSIFNAVLVIVVFAVLEKRKITRLIYPLIATNYYLYVLMFSAERLKFAFLMVLICSLVPSRWKIAAAISAVLFHFQAIFFAAGYFGNRAAAIFRGVASGRLQGRQLAALFAFGFGLFVLQLIFGAEISSKIAYYTGSGLGELTKLSMFFAISLFLAHDKLVTFLIFLPLAFASVVLGDDRVNLVTFAFALSTSFTWNRGLNPISIAMLFYFSWRGIAFLADVARLGTGFQIDLQ